MTDPLRVLIVHADEGGCGHYRLLFPSDALADDDSLVITRDLRAQSVLGMIDKDWAGDPNVSMIKYVEPQPYDVMVLQRPLDKSMVDSIPHIQEGGTAVVVELDDDFWHIHPENRAFHTDRQLPYSNKSHLARACKLADLVTVSTPPLAAQVKRLGAKRVKVLRNCVPARYLTVERAEGEWSIFDGRTIVGWSGKRDTHPGDLEVTGGAVKRAVQSTGAQFFAIGDETASDALGFDRGETVYQPAIVFAKYPGMVAGLDVGIVPLRLSPFNEAKSYLKGLEYAALGVPFVATPTQEYRELSSEACGWLAKNSGDWARLLRTLIENADLRASLAAVSKGVVSAKFTYEVNAHRWADTWRLAAELKRKAMA